MPVLTSLEIEEFLQNAPGWRLDEGMLVHDWSFKDFVEALEFVNHVAALAESSNHHPDIDIRYNKVRLGFTSHDAGGITSRDTHMAGRITQELAD